MAPTDGEGRAEHEAVVPARVTQLARWRSGREVLGLDSLCTVATLGGGTGEHRVGADHVAGERHHVLPVLVS